MQNDFVKPVLYFARMNAGIKTNNNPSNKFITVISTVSISTVSTVFSLYYNTQYILCFIYYMEQFIFSKHQILTNSTRRFFARPSSVELSAIGAV